MVYRWNDRKDVDEAVVVVMNTLDAGQEVRGWLMRTMQQAIYDSDPGFADYFFKELEASGPRRSAWLSGNRRSDPSGA
ncbi:hypothetical protein [Methanoculleus sp. 10]|uniref:hypothetical protein n=1 Tax=Methanoculleus sp. 10 TaxID=430615 RepID=UPI0025E849F3|nr:hypothetical protein [Methanoculleus sp. 10]